MTPVIFRRDGDEIVAVFPTIEADPGQATCYAHIGQHSGCSRQWYYETRPAKPAEYADLLAELVDIGYDDLKIYRRWSYHMGE
jgi:hypothetical protein